MDAAVSHPLELAGLDLASGAALAPRRWRIGVAEPTCLFCGHAIGLPTEPVVVIKHEGERQTSLGGEPKLAQRPVTCAPARLG